MCHSSLPHSCSHYLSTLVVSGFCVLCSVFFRDLLSIEVIIYVLVCVCVCVYNIFFLFIYIPLEYIYIFILREKNVGVDNKASRGHSCLKLACVFLAWYH